MANNDHFSGFAATYASFRPTYPATLFAWLAEVAPGRAHAWDCATGTGQAALALTQHFDHVTATDIGAAMIAHAAPHPRITYAVAPAESPNLAAKSVDLVTVAMALHWFDLPPFWNACRRILRPGGVLAYWGYLLPSISPSIDALISHYHDITVGPYWPLDRGPLMNGYADVQPDFGTRLPSPEISMSAEWTVGQLLGLLESWSATHRARAASGTDPLQLAAPEIHQAWGPEPQSRTVTWPLHVHAFRL